MDTIYVGNTDWWLLIRLLTANVVLALFVLQFLRETWQKLLLVLMSISVFVYSGYGIAYSEVPDFFGYKYIIYMLCLYIPIIVYSKKHHPRSLTSITDFDCFVFKNPRFIKVCAYFYLLCEFIPLIYPEFKLFDAFKNPFGSIIGFYSKINAAEGNVILSLLNTLKLFMLPLFIAYLMQLKNLRPNSRLPLILLCLDVFFRYSFMTYLSRYQMVLYALLIYMLIKTRPFKIEIDFKSIFTITVIGILSMPLLFLFTYTRAGDVYTGPMSFGGMINGLLETETYYPVYYEHIINSLDLKDQTPLVFILWVICLPVPSFIWPNKPKISPDAFTYSLTGLRRTDVGYSSSLPSEFGEALMFFDEHTYWIHALIVGFVIVTVIGYVAKHKTLSFYAVYLILFSLTLGRGGASSYLSTVVNGSVSIFLIDLLCKGKYPAALKQGTIQQQLIGRR